MLRVAAGVLVDPAGRVLLAERPPGKQLAGFHEFPGGKLEVGESVVQALHRELREELAIDAGTIDPLPLIEVPWRHGGLELRLIAHRVRAWTGAPRACEGQILTWSAPAEVDPATLAPADRHILHGLRLPRHYPVTPDVPTDTPVASIQAMLRAAVADGETLLQLRLPAWSVEAVRELAADCLPWLREAGATALLNGDIDGARQLGIGVHLRAAQLAMLSDRPLPQGQWVGASCHNADELSRAQAIGVDFVVLSPVQPTPTHPATTTLGWTRLARLVAATPLPVYALGGVGPDDLSCARASGAQGVAGIRAFWPHVSKP